MITIAQFKHFLFKKSLEKSKERYALYNYLDSFCRGGEPLKPALLNDFYKRALLFSYWQARLPQLRAGIEEEIASIQKINPLRGFAVQDMSFNKQLIALQDKKDVKTVIQNFCLQKKSGRIKILNLEGDHVLAVILQPKGELTAYSFGPLMQIHKGALKPLSPLSGLYYSPHLELREDSPHIVEMPHKKSFIYFYSAHNKISGYECTAPFFKKVNVFNNLPIEEHSGLFPCLKSMERFFIDPKSDIHYKKLVELLHEHYRKMLGSHAPQARDNTEFILLKARKALKNFYPEDKLLTLLTANVEFHLRKSGKTFAPSIEPS